MKNDKLDKKTIRKHHVAKRRQNVQSIFEQSDKPAQERPLFLKQPQQKPRVVVTFNHSVGSASPSLKKSFLDIDTDMVDGDYREIMPATGHLDVIHTDVVTRDKVFLQAKQNATYCYPLFE